MRFVNRPRRNGRLRITSAITLLFAIAITTGFLSPTVDSADKKQNVSRPPQNNGNRKENVFFGFFGGYFPEFFDENVFRNRTGAERSHVFKEFDEWLRAFAEKGFKAEASETNVGEELARRRIQILRETAQNDPQAALENSLSAEKLDRLPSVIAENSEKRISAYGDFLVYAIDEIDRETGMMTGARTERFVVINGKQYEAYVYGRRLSMTTKYNIPLQGIVIGNAIVLDESPARLMSPEELADEPKPQDGTAAQIGGKLVYFRDRGEFDEFTRRQIEWESKIQPALSDAEAAQKDAITAPGSTWTEGAKTVLVIRVDFSDRPGEPVDHYNQPLTASRAQNLISNEVSPFYINNSYNKTLMTPTVTPVVRLPQTLAYYAQGYYNTMLADARAAARAAGYETNNFNLDLVAFSYTPSIGWAGIAAIGAKGAMLNGAFYLAETAHELGHCYGLLHANLWRTIDGSVIGAGNNVEYGDCYDNMGACVNGNASRHFNSHYKRRLNWLTESDVQTVTTNGTYRIYAQDLQASSGIRTLKIPKNASKNYWVEFRQLQSGNAMNGALVRWDYSSQSFRETQLLDMNPATSSTADAPLTIGQSFYDAENQIRITVLGKGGTTPESLDVRVEFGGATPTPTPTATPTPNCTLSLSPSGANVSAAGGNGSFIVSTQNNCSWNAASGASWINITGGSGGTGGGNVFYAVQPNNGTTRTGTISVNGQTFTVTQNGTSGAPNRTAFDFDGDGRADAAVYRLEGGFWYFMNSNSGFTGVQFGIGTDKITPGDYDGDGKTDIAVFRNGTWYLLRSSAGFTGIDFGLSGDIPIQTDFDGDGKTELTVFRPSAGAVYSLNLADNQFRSSTFGAAGDKLVFADYDGDGRTDEAVFRNGAWHIMQSSNGQYRGEHFGQAGDVPVPADYDGDGRTDLAVFRGGIWYIMRSSAGFTGVQFGITSDKPVPADYDGDGKADIAVYREGTWHILESADGAYRSLQFGLPSDQPVPAAFR